MASMGIHSSSVWIILLWCRSFISKNDLPVNLNQVWILWLTLDLSLIFLFSSLFLIFFLWSWWNQDLEINKEDGKPKLLRHWKMVDILFLHLDTPLCWDVLRRVHWETISLSWRYPKNFWLRYSPPRSDQRILIGLHVYFSTLFLNFWTF